MEKIIITGADGFVGSHTTSYFLNQGKTVLAIDLEAVPLRLRQHPRLTYMQCDVSDTEALLKRIPQGTYDTFIHFAWEGSAGEGRMDYRLQMQNALNTVECLKVAKALGCKRFVGAGSIMELEVEAAIHTQGSRPQMSYVYGEGKHMAHTLCKSVAADCGVDLLWPMITNAYGVGEWSPRFVNNTLRKMINGEPLRFTAATQNYDFVYVTDVAKAFYLVAERGEPFCEYLIDSGQARPLKEFILEMVATCSPGSKPLFGDVPFTGTSLPLTDFGIDAIRRDCGFEVKVPFGEGVRRTMDWLKTKTD